MAAVLVTAPASEPVSRAEAKAPAAPQGFAPSPNPEGARRGFLQAFEQDLQNIEDGLYPAPRDFSVREAFRALESSRLYL